MCYVQTSLWCVQYLLASAGLTLHTLYGHIIISFAPISGYSKLGLTALHSY